MAQGTTKGVPIDTDPLLTADSDLLVPSQKAIKTYVDNSNINQVTSVTGTSPIVSSGGTAPVISIPQATGSENGYLSSGDWTTFNTKVSATRNISTTAPLAGGGDLSANRTLSITQATTSTDGYLSSTDWNTFNNKISNSSWVDYSATTTTTGWVSFTTKKVQYRLLGSNTLLVQFQLEGTSNASSASFTLPNNASSWGTQYFMFHVTNTSSQVAGLGLINASSNTVTFSVNLSTGGTNSWSSTGAKNVRGQVIVSI